MTTRTLAVCAGVLVGISLMAGCVWDGYVPQKKPEPKAKARKPKPRKPKAASKPKPPKAKPEPSAPKAKSDPNAMLPF